MNRRRIIAALVVLTAVAACFAAPAGAQSTPQPIENESDYYNNETGPANMTEWAPNDGNTTATGLLDMIARIPGMFIGSGDLDPSGSGYQGVLLTSLIIGAAALMGTVGVGVGPIAGAMIGMVLAFGLTLVGLVPQWIQPLLLFALVGVPAARAIIAVFRS